MRRAAISLALPILLSAMFVLAAALSGPPPAREGAPPAREGAPPTASTPSPAPAPPPTAAPAPASPPTAAPAPAGQAEPARDTAPADSLPRLVDLGAGKCIPCKKMAPILESLRADYAGVVNVVFVDVWKDPKAGKPYKIRVIPTQVFFNAKDVEVFRHEGFFSREEIEKVFLEKFGVPPRKPGEGGATPPGER